MTKSHRLFSCLFMTVASLAAAGVQAQGGGSGPCSDFSLYGAGRSYIGLNAG